MLALVEALRGFVVVATMMCLISPSVVDMQVSMMMKSESSVLLVPLGLIKKYISGFLLFAFRLMKNMERK